MFWSKFFVVVVFFNPASSSLALSFQMQISQFAAIGRATTSNCVSSNLSRQGIQRLHCRCCRCLDYSRSGPLWRAGLNIDWACPMCAPLKVSFLRLIVDSLQLSKTDSVSHLWTTTKVLSRSKSSIYENKLKKKWLCTGSDLLNVNCPLERVLWTDEACLSKSKAQSLQIMNLPLNPSY